MTNITAENISSRHIYLSWTQPCHPNGIISNYTIEVTNKSDSSNAVQDIRFTNNTSTIFNVTNLLPYRSYLFYVKTQVQNVSSMSNSTTSAVYNTSTEGNQFVLIQLIQLHCYLFNLHWWKKIKFKYFKYIYFCSSAMPPWKNHNWLYQFYVGFFIVVGS